MYEAFQEDHDQFFMGLPRLGDFFTKPGAIQALEVLSRQSNALPLLVRVMCLAASL